MVGHVPIELSQLLYHFLNTGTTENKLTAVVTTGKRKREIGVVVSARYTDTTIDRGFADVLIVKLNEKGGGAYSSGALI